MQWFLTEFNKDVLGRIECNLLEIFAHQNLDRVLVPVFRNVLAHEVSLQQFQKGKLKTVSCGSNLAPRTLKYSKTPTKYDMKY